MGTERTLITKKNMTTFQQLGPLFVPLNEATKYDSNSKVRYNNMTVSWLALRIPLHYADCIPLFSLTKSSCRKINSYVQMPSAGMHISNGSKSIAIL